MNRFSHFIEPEEVMSYLDGELGPARAAEVAAHLRQCAECQEVSAELRSVSQQLFAFEVEPASERMTEKILIAAKASPASNETTAKARDAKWLLSLRRLHWGRYAFAAGCVVVAIGIVALQSARYKPGLEHLKDSGLTGPASYQSPLVGLPQSRSTPAPAPPPPVANEQEAQKAQAAESVVDQFRASFGRNEGHLSAPELSGPMIAQAASLTLQISRFDGTREAVERVVAQHQGYIIQLNEKSQVQEARELTATLRVPASQLDAALADLRKLGRVVEESRASEDVSAQHVDLIARLRSARATEQRILALLAQRTGKLSDVLEAEQELARIRGEIESMDGQRAALEHRVVYASIELRAGEQYREQLRDDSVPVKIRMRNAFVEGYRNLMEGLIGLLLFLFSYGPALLFWAAILFFPARFAWRRFRTKGTAEVPPTRAA